MKIHFKTSKSKLNNSLKAFKNFFKNKRTQILLLKTKNNELILFSKSNNNFLKLSLECKIIESGEVSVDFVKFEKAVKELNSNDIYLETNNSKILINTVKKTFELEKKNNIQFQFSNIKYKNKVVLEKKDFIKNLKESSYFSEKKDDLSWSYGIRIENENNYIKYISSDECRILCIKNKLNNRFNDFKLTIPFNVVKALINLKSFSKNKNIEFSFSEKSIEINFGNIKIGFEILSDFYPDYISLFNQKNKKEYQKIILNKNYFANKLKEISLINETATFRFKNDSFIISHNEEINEKIKTVSNLNFDGEAKIHLRLKYLLDFINLIDVENIEFYFYNNVNPLFLIPESNLLDSPLYCFMPLLTRY